ncbi:hypothetical protein BDF20DRAFT_870630 [Mycotypha africana]|uniref:uncharacterized protein n=1 Tax=Mycotypha africana TaxID=64632 RepID=UPI00230110CB|nr:uncharacterized protein BDF20DRAFT_870630 [Mycotypha africana]KAI8979610.1 hypothetical protein BDF20DRAFT_870630 [Mycotypha africana]
MPSPNPFLLTFDHIKPKSLGGSCRISNVQVILSCLNQVKGTASNKELRQWLNSFHYLIDNCSEP